VALDEEEGGQKGRYIAEYNLDVEIDARKNLIRAFLFAIAEYTQAIEQIARATDLPNGSTDGEMKVELNQVVLAHFKAKRPDGETVKSKKPREARVVRVEEDGMIRVEFVANKKRHMVPTSWIVGAKPVPSAGLLTSGCTSARLSRGKLAITLLRGERAILNIYSQVMLKSVDDLEDKSRRYDRANRAEDKTEADKLVNTIQGFLHNELVHVDQEMEWQMPQSLADCPQLDELLTGEVDKTRPMWNMPAVHGSYAPEGVKLLSDGEGDREEEADGEPSINDGQANPAKGSR